MKYLKRILLIVFLMSLCTNTNASSPAEYKDIPSKTTLIQGEVLTIERKVTYGNVLNYLVDKDYIDFQYDTNLFEFVSFESDYNFKYDNNTKHITNEVLESGNGGGFILPFYVERDKEPVKIWKFAFKLKDDAKTGQTIIEGNTYTIVAKKIDEVSDNEIKTETKTETKTDNSDNNIVYILLGLNALLIVTLLVVILKKNK